MKAIARLLHIVTSFKAAPENACHGWHKCDKNIAEEQLQQTKAIIIRAVQSEVYADDIRHIERGESVPKQSPLSKLNPIMDTNMILRVGRRLTKAQITVNETHPILIPSKHHVNQLIIRHFDSQVCHQGRHFSEGAIRAAGFWIVGGKRAIRSLIFNCVTCRRLRGKQQEQIMSDLREDRMCTNPPFTCVGFDVFGPWPVTVRKTCGSQAEAKRWAVIFTCMIICAIHIEVLESMNT